MNTIAYEETDGILSATVLLMMILNKIYHINLALQQSRSLMKILYQLKFSFSPRLFKKLISLSDNLAAIISK
jgi:hypothetical protein